MRVKFSASVVAGDLDAADALRFLDRLLRPRAGDDVVGRAARGQQVHRHHRELQAGAALQKEHVVALGNAAPARACPPRSLAMISSNGFDRWLISRIDMPTPGSDSRSRCACSSTSTGRTAGPAEKLKIRVVVVMSLVPNGHEVPDWRLLRHEANDLQVENVGVPALMRSRRELRRRAVQVDARDGCLGAFEDDVLRLLHVQIAPAQVVEDVGEHAGTVAVADDEHVRRGRSRSPGSRRSAPGRSPCSCG